MRSLSLLAITAVTALVLTLPAAGQTQTSDDIATGTPGPLQLSNGALLLRQSDGSLLPVQPLVDVTFSALSWHPAGTFALVVGEGGTVLRYFSDGTQDIVDSPTPEDLLAVSWAPSAPVPYALVIGAGGQVLKYDGLADRVALLTDTDLPLVSITWKDGYALLTGADGQGVTYGAKNQQPSVQIAAPSEGSHVSGVVTILGYASDDDGSVLRVELLLEDGAWHPASGTAVWTHRWDTSDLRGEQVVYARAWDGFSFSPLARLVVTADAPVGVRPSVEILTPQPAEVLTGVMAVTGTSADADGSPVLVELRVDDGPWEAVQGTSSWSLQLDTQELGNGAHVIHARAFDGNLYSTEAGVAVTVENPNHPPIVALDSPNSGAIYTNGERTVLDARASFDPDGDLLSFAWSSDRDGDLGTGEFDVVQLQPGLHHLSLRVSDGTETVEAGVTVQVVDRDNAVPTVQVLSPRGGSEVQGLITVLVSAADEDKDELLVEVRFDNGVWRQASPVEGATFWSVGWDTRGLSAGTHTITARSYDGSAYSVIDSERVTIARTTTAPGGSIQPLVTTADEDRPAIAKTVSVVAASLFGLLVLLLGLVEVLRYGALKALFLPLYTRLKKDEILDNFTRGAIFGFIVANPGAHYNLIKQELRLNNGAILYHLDILEKEEYVVSERAGIYRRFYARAAPRDFSRPTDIQGQILEEIRRTPGVTQRALSARIGLTTRALNYHVKMLLRNGVLGMERRGRKTFCYANRTAQAPVGSLEMVPEPPAEIPAPVGLPHVPAA